MSGHTEEYYRSLVIELSKLPTETEWVEFKTGNADTERIAKYISALSNSAALAGRPSGYLIWGVDDQTHDIVGTDFRYRSAKKGNEELEAWLTRMINPKIGFTFDEVTMAEGINVTVLTVPRATTEPTKFESAAYVRIGSNLRPLNGFRELEARLWRAFESVPAELRIVASAQTTEQIANLLDFSGYYRALGTPIPSGRNKVLDDLAKEKFIIRNDAGGWDITGLGALGIAFDLSAFPDLARRSVRVIKYEGLGRTGKSRPEQEFRGGYAVSFEEIIRYIMAVTPQEEILDGAIRRSKTAFPEVAVRELLANAMIHQDLNQRGTNPMVEIFDNRIEFANAGGPLVDVGRIVDTVPVSRNEALAGFMRKCGICEERGSGYDKVIEATCANGLIAPAIQGQGTQFTKVALFSRTPFELTTKDDRIRTCYMQACLAYVRFSTIANADVRETFGLPPEKKAAATRVIRDCLAAGLIKPVDPSAAPKNMRYVPFWA